MKISFFCLLFLILFAPNKSSGQDSVRLVFKKLKIILPNHHESALLKLQDSSYFETIIDIDKGKFFYIKQQIRDTLTVESGQLALYNISNKFYLLREGIWTLEASSDKVLFRNLGKKGLLEEVRVHFQPFEYEGFDKKKNIKHVMSTKH
jgi:hypothetical protein